MEPATAQRKTAAGIGGDGSSNISNSTPEILCGEPAERSISEDTTTTREGPLHSFASSPSAGAGSSEVDVASSEVSQGAAASLSMLEGPNSSNLLIFLLVCVHRKKA